ncbi:MAG: UDP-N-acetylmuramoyl-L-alanine--D-glutamate ligase, partial [Oscillospiraceae bacterium]
PGLPFSTPQLQAALANGQIVTSELEVFLALCPCKTWGVTGSDGKTTTASLLAEMLRRTGKPVHLGGNIGKPLLPILDKISENDLCVVELSSFQLISMRCSPDVAVLTNISPNHLDLHKDMAEYIAAKCNILDHQDAFSRAVISRDCAEAAAQASRVRGRLSWFSRREPVENGAWMDEHGDIFHSVGGRAVGLFSRREVLLPGLHNIENLLAATAAAWGTVSPRDVAAVAKSFAGVEHRIEFVAKVGGARWYNDSIATSPTRTVAGLMSFDEKLIVIAGGYDKHLAFEPLAKPLIDRCKALILTGPTAERIEAAVVAHPDFSASGLQILHAADLDGAVRQAYALCGPGDV